MSTELVQPIGRVWSLRALYGVENVVIFLEAVTSIILSYPTYKFSVPPHDKAAYASASSSVAGGRLECAIVTAFSGSKL